MRHEDADLARRVELAGALALAFGELAQQVLVGPAEDVRLHVLQAQPVLVEDLDQRGKLLVVEHPLPGGGGVEVGDVDDARQARVLPGHGPHGVGEALRPGPVVCLAMVRPAGFVRDEEAHQVVVGFHQLGRPSRPPNSCPGARTSSSNTSDRRLRKISGRM